MFWALIDNTCRFKLKLWDISACNLVVLIASWSL